MKAEGQTGLVLLVPALDPLIGRWRERYDPVTAYGMPAHVTVVYPWKPAATITESDRAALAELHVSCRPSNCPSRDSAASTRLSGSTRNPPVPSVG